MVEGLKQKILEKAKSEFRCNRCNREFPNSQQNHFAGGHLCEGQIIETKWVKVDGVVAVLDEVTNQIEHKLISIDKLRNPDEILTMTKRKFAEDFNQEIREVLAVLDGEKKP